MNYRRDGGPSQRRFAPPVLPFGRATSGAVDETAASPARDPAVGSCGPDASGAEQDDCRTPRPSCRRQAPHPARRRSRRRPFGQRGQLRRARQECGVLGQHHDALPLGDRGGNLRQDPSRGRPRPAPDAHERMEDVPLGQCRVPRQGPQPARSFRDAVDGHGLGCDQCQGGRGRA